MVYKIIRKTILTLAFILSVISFFAQEQGFLTGKITDKNHNEIVGASVVVMQNETIIVGSSTNFDGTYNVSLSSGNYIVEVTALACSKEKKGIEIKLGEAINLDFQLSEARYNIITIYDTVRINAIELKNINNKFKIVIDNHIKESRKKLFFPKQKENIIVIHLSDRNYYYQEEVSINNKNLKYKEFKENSFGDGYDINIMFIGKKNEAIRNELSRNRNHFHYKYKNWDVLFGTQIEKFEFPFAEDMKKYEFYFQYKDIEDDKNGKYGMSDKKIEKFRYGCTIYKRYEIFETAYFISN